MYASNMTFSSHSSTTSLFPSSIRTNASRLPSASSFTTPSTQATHRKASMTNESAGVVEPKAPETCAQLAPQGVRKGVRTTWPQRRRWCVDRGAAQTRGGHGTAEGGRTKRAGVAVVAVGVSPSHVSMVGVSASVRSKAEVEGSENSPASFGMSGETSSVMLGCGRRVFVMVGIMARRWVVLRCEDRSWRSSWLRRSTAKVQFFFFLMNVSLFFRKGIADCGNFILRVYGHRPGGSCKPVIQGGLFSAVTPGFRRFRTNDISVESFVHSK
ncbi:hypothetical protein B0J12DRAFT_656354 [Macrophomina phaseolina]|uniref:Uncharacterized protein n=1 Tax=Macrophomina phaseolina TaxID=35725 RepID=A0ABQ8GHL3_9PEZI|nr:hypothetical protein B0J12DRAFT_656354 [Macrophomina phaseolina]